MRRQNEQKKAAQPAVKKEFRVKWEHETIKKQFLI
jgi:hypothetical protein